jgi:16S rRNA processing protein RimM
MVRIGKIAATRGLGGSIVLTHVVGSAAWVKEGLPLFVELRKESRIPYFVSKVERAGDEDCVVMLEDISGVEAARPLVGKAVYVENVVLEKGADERSPLRWIGYKLVDKTLGGLGQIEDVMQAGAQWLAQIRVEEKEVLIPLADAFVLEVNTRNKYVRMDLPEGLLDL